MTLKLISFDLCPYVQRSVITLKRKNIPFEIEYIDLANKPDWFLKLSPLGKVPILIVDDKDVIFESAVINEYIDEISGGDLLPSDPLEKAKARAWIEYAGGQLMHLYQAGQAQDQETYETHVATLIDGLMKMKDVAKGPYFLGDEFSLVDSSIAPLFVRMKFLADVADRFSVRAKADAPNLLAWFNELTAKDKGYIQSSAPANLAEKYQSFFEAKGSYIFKNLKAA